MRRPCGARVDLPRVESPISNASFLRSGRRRAPPPSRESSLRSVRAPARIARSTGAAPRHRVATGCTFSQSERSKQARRVVEPVGADDDAVDVLGESPGLLGLVDGMPSCSAISLPAAGRACDRGLRRVGTREQPGDLSCCSASRSRTSAPTGAVAATPIFISLRPVRGRASGERKASDARTQGASIAVAIDATETPAARTAADGSPEGGAGPGALP